MTKKGTKKKSKESGEDSDVEIIPGTRTETILEDTKEFTGISPKFKWGGLYQMMRDQEIPDTSLEEMVLYQNIRRPSITKAAMCQELFPFSISLLLIQFTSHHVYVHVSHVLFLTELG